MINSFEKGLIELANGAFRWHTRANKRFGFTLISGGYASAVGGPIKLTDAGRACLAKAADSPWRKPGEPEVFHAAIAAYDARRAA